MKLSIGAGVAGLDMVVELGETASLPCRAMLEVVERWDHGDLQDVTPRP